MIIFDDRKEDIMTIYKPRPHNPNKPYVPYKPYITVRPWQIQPSEIAIPEINQEVLMKFLESFASKPKKKKKDKMKIYFLLDRSGSMNGCWDETLKSINLYVKELNNSSDVKKAKISLYAFDSEKPFLKVREKTKLKEWSPITNREITTGAMTPLYDAVSSLSEVISNEDPSKASIVILTDGMENSSKSSTSAQMKSSISEWKNKGYDVVVIGADFDALSKSKTYGLSKNFTINIDKSKMSETMRHMSLRHSKYAKSGLSESFSDAVRSELS